MFLFSENYNDMRSVTNLSHIQHSGASNYGYGNQTHQRMSPYSSQASQLTNNYFDMLQQQQPSPSSPSTTSPSPNSPLLVNNNNNNNNVKVIINGENQNLERATVVSLSS